MRHFSKMLFAVSVVVISLMASPGTASASSGEASAVWLASVAGEPAVGRLSIKDDTLSFALASEEWHVPLAEISKVSILKGSDRTLKIQTVNGDVLLLTIRSSQLLAASPKPALQRIERAMKEAAPPRRPTLAAVAPAGSDR
jgi:hypothetical protein